jgi:LAO/AO transport system kinase
VYGLSPRSAALLEAYAAGDQLALAKLLTRIESGAPDASAILQAARRAAAARPRPRILGITGSPGSGKSTLISALIQLIRARGERAAVLCVDPSSPFGGGAVLGDRIRMGAHFQDQGVYIRSLSSRGLLGGLSPRTPQIAALLECFGFDWILIETVGVGQSEVDVAQVGDLVVLVLNPNQGDGVQVVKSGVLEIADLVAINKADLPGAGQLARDLRFLSEGRPAVQVYSLIAASNQGVGELFAAVESAWQPQQAEKRALERARLEVAQWGREWWNAEISGLGVQELEQVRLGQSDSLQLARRLQARLTSAHSAARSGEGDQ